MKSFRSSSSAAKINQQRDISLDKKQSDLKQKIHSLKKNKENYNKTTRSIHSNKLPPSANNSLTYFNNFEISDEKSQFKSTINFQYKSQNKSHNKSHLFSHNTQQLRNLLFENENDEIHEITENEQSNILQEINQGNLQVQQTPKIDKIKKQIFQENTSILKSNNQSNFYQSKSKIKSQKRVYQRLNNFDENNVNDKENYNPNEQYSQQQQNYDQIIDEENIYNKDYYQNLQKQSSQQKKHQYKSQSHNRFYQNKNQIQNNFSIYSLASCGQNHIKKIKTSTQQDDEQEYNEYENNDNNNDQTFTNCDECDKHQQELQYMQQQLQIAKRQWLLIHHKQEYKENSEFMKVNPLQQTCKVKYQQYLKNRKTSDKLKKLIQNHKHTVIHKLY